MADHLPECHYGEPVRGGHILHCICDRLRACEARVVHTIRRDSWYEDGYAAGIAAARAIVADSPTAAPTDDSRLLIRREAALAAIDALKGDPHV